MSEEYRIEQGEYPYKQRMYPALYVYGKVSTEQQPFKTIPNVTQTVEQKAAKMVIYRPENETYPYITIPTEGIERDEIKARLHKKMRKKLENSGEQDIHGEMSSEEFWQYMLNDHGGFHGE